VFTVINGRLEGAIALADYCPARVKASHCALKEMKIAA